MHDEFRIRVDVGHERLHEVLDGLAAHEDDGRYAVSHDEDTVFVYSDSAASAEQARAATERAIGGDHALTIERWHPLEERWEDASVPLPADDAALRAEHDRLRAAEDEESKLAGYPEWEVRISLPSHHDARELAQRLEGEGIPTVRRWRFLLVGANDEDQARDLADRLRSEAPPGSEIHVEGSAGEPMRAYYRSRSAFAVFGGLGV